MKQVYLLILSICLVQSGFAQWETLIGDTSHFVGLLVQGDTIVAGTNTGELYMSADDGANWQPITGDLPSYYIDNIAVRDDGALVCTAGNAVYVSTNWYNWTNILSMGGSATTMLIRGQTILAGADFNGGLHASFDNGQTWSQISQGVVGQYSTSVAFRGDTIFWSRLAVPTVLYTTDSGETWMDEPAFTEGIFTLSPDGKYAGSYWSIYDRTDTGWTEYLTNTQILDIKVAEGYVAAVGYGTDLFLSSTVQTQWWPIALPNGLEEANKVAVSNGYLYVASWGGLYRMALENFVGIEERMRTDLLIYPNPSNGNVMIDWSRSELSPVTLEVFNVTGRSIKTMRVGDASSKQLILNDLPIGVYQLVFTTESFVFGERLVISH